MAVADPGGAPGASPYGPKCSQFHPVFLEHFGKIVCWRPLDGWRPPSTGNPGSAPEWLAL